MDQPPPPAGFSATAVPAAKSFPSRLPSRRGKNRGVFARLLVAFLFFVLLGLAAC